MTQLMHFLNADIHLHVHWPEQCRLVGKRHTEVGIPKLLIVWVIRLHANLRLRHLQQLARMLQARS